MESFAELTSDPALRARLEALYDDDIDRLEWYVGIFAEEYPDYLMMGELLTTMVANDAFTQALTNPVLARSVFNEADVLAGGHEDHRGDDTRCSRSSPGTRISGETSSPASSAEELESRGRPGLVVRHVGPSG